MLVALVFETRANAYYSKGQYDRAIQDYEQAIKLDPKDEKAFCNRSHAYADKGQHDRATQDYDQAVKLDPNKAEALAAGGLAYAHKKPSCPPL